jgi:hypothetical protein
VLIDPKAHGVWPVWGARGLWTLEEAGRDGPERRTVAQADAAEFMELARRRHQFEASP